MAAIEAPLVLALVGATSLIVLGYGVDAIGDLYQVIATFVGYPYG